MFFPMKPPLSTFFSLMLLLGAAPAVSAQTAAPEAPPPAKAEAAPAPPAEPVVRKAVPSPVDPNVIVDIDKLPHTIPADAKITYSQTHTPGKVIAITFDDGPSPQNTPRLLDMLKERHIKATFFLIGKSAATWPDIVKRIVAEGHEVANHSWTHPQFTKIGTAKTMEELQLTHDAIIKACGVTPIMFRPPYGAATLTQKKAIHERFGYTCVLWDVDPEDWKSPKSVEKVHDQVIGQTRPGSIILCHDIHKETVDAMPVVLDELKAKGYQFCTVTQIINLDAQTAKIAAEAKAKAEAEKAEEDKDKDKDKPKEPAEVIKKPEPAGAAATTELPPGK